MYVKSSFSSLQKTLGALKLLVLEMLNPLDGTAFACENYSTLEVAAAV